MNDIMPIIERFGFPVAIIIFGAWFFLLPLRDAALRFIGTLESFLTVAGQDIHGLKSTTSSIDEKVEKTSAKVEVIGERVHEMSGMLGGLKKEAK